jgi:guanylate kinase
MNEPPLIIVSGPSGSGKSTIIGRILAEGELPLKVSVSATTRPPRPGERDGIDYHFWTPERFEEEVRAGSFLEWAKVHGACYGTLWREVEPPRRQGKIVILDIDVQGAAQLRRLFPDAVTVFLRTSSWSAYEERLRRRHTEDEAAIRGRLETAKKEMEHASEYRYQVINDDLDTAVAEFRRILNHCYKRESHVG